MRKVTDTLDDLDARQSVKSEEVAEAIEELSQASDRLHYAQDGAHVKTPISLATIDLAITALKQMRSKPCDKSCPIGCDFYDESGTATKCPVCGKLVTE